MNRTLKLPLINKPKKKLKLIQARIPEELATPVIKQLKKDNLKIVDLIRAAFNAYKPK